MRAVTEQFESYAKLNRKIAPESVSTISDIIEPGKLADAVASQLQVKLAEKQGLLELSDVKDRLEKVLSLMEGEMGMMQMEIPDNTVPMMTGWGPHGPIEMGGMFSVVKVRPDVEPGDYSDPGWYENPPGTEAYEWTGELPEFTSNDSPRTILTKRQG